MGGSRFVDPMTSRAPTSWWLLAGSTCSFFLYNRLSLSVLLRLDAVAHSVCNALRRAATVAVAAALFATPVSLASVLGIVLVIGGSAGYALSAAARGGHAMQPVRGEVAPADDGLLSTAGSAAEADANTAESGERFADKSAGAALAAAAGERKWKGNTLTHSPAATLREHKLSHDLASAVRNAWGSDGRRAAAPSAVRSKKLVVP
eukprot:scaffold14374_cov208-Isochrysis_galbana.AAC.2